MGNDDGFYNPHEKTIEYEVFFFRAADHRG